MTESIYGSCGRYLPLILEDLETKLSACLETEKERSGRKLYEHLEGRVKSEKSMMEKCVRKNLPQNPESALRKIHDAIGIRMITGFVDDIYLCAGWIRNLPGCRVISEKDYIRNAKKNGYRSYHILLETEVPWPDIEGRTPGQFYAEVQIRTIAMDSWASLEHRLHYKKNIANAELITAELKRCADELAACDLSMQTIRKLIEESAEEER